MKGCLSTSTATSDSSNWILILSFLMCPYPSLYHSFHLHIPIEELQAYACHELNLTITMASSISPPQLSSSAVARRPTAASPLQSSKSICYGFCPATSQSFTRVVSVSAVGDVSADSNIYLFAGAAAVALIGTAFPIFFARKDLCPECDGAGFIRQAGAKLRANAARKDQSQIVCPRCNGLGKLGQIDK